MTGIARTRQAVLEGAFTSAKIVRATGIPKNELTTYLSRLVRSGLIVAVPYECDCCGFQCVGYYEKEIKDERQEEAPAEAEADGVLS